MRLRHEATLASVHFVVWLTTLMLAILAVKRDALATSAGMVVVLIFLSVKAAMALYAGSFKSLWRHVSVEDLAALTRNSLITTLVLVLILAAVPQLGVPSSVAIIDGVLTLLLLGMVQIAPRLFFEVVRPAIARGGRRIILAGRPEFVDLELRRIQLRETQDAVVGLVFEGPSLVGARLRQIPVLSRRELEDKLKCQEVAAIIIVPPAQSAFQRDLERLGGAFSVQCHVVNSLQSLGDVIETASGELLNRSSTEINNQTVSRFIAGRRVLITGAGGSLGSELSRQMLRHGPSALALVERSENAMFRIESDLTARNPTFPIEPHLLDICDRAAVKRLFETFRPEVVLHAAAHKHVPMMERQPSEAVLNNVGGTRRLADAAHAYGVDTFVFISTDKAVNPTSVMGASKRLGELYLKAMSHLGTTRFVAVRFGNVLGSSGSVLPIFVEQIKRGGPVTVTHPEMNRFFMSIPEACRLVLEAAVLGHGGEMYVLDMGKPVRIVDLARRLIERAGLRPGSDVPIVYSGMRPGEKLSEELTYSNEDATHTSVPGIFAIKSEMIDPQQIINAIDAMEKVAETGDERAVIRMMQKIIPEYRQTHRPRHAPNSGKDTREAAAS